MKLLDTNICVAFMRRRDERLRRRFEILDPAQLCVCSVVRAELLYGAVKSRLSQQNFQNTLEFLSLYESLPFDDRAADVYSRLRNALEEAGTQIGVNDLLIASIALANGVTLVTHNTREFERIDGLKLEDWLTP